MTTTNNQRKRNPWLGGPNLVALFLVGLGIFSCTQHPAQDVVRTTPATKQVQPIVPTHEDTVNLAKAEHSAFSLYKAGLKAIEKKDWLEAQYSLDQALSELAANIEDSTRTKDSVAAQKMTLDVIKALELVYPHLSELGKIDPEMADMLEPTELDEIDDSVDDEPLDSADLTWLTKELDTLNLKQFSLPVELNERVLREVNFLTHGVHSFTEGSLSRKKNFNDMVLAKLKEHGMPEDLIYLSFIESGFKTKAYSRAKASGLWQFIPGTGKRYGLQVDFWVDMRRNPEAATEAALGYLKDLHDEFGDWLLAMAAYNCGEGRIRKLVGDSSTYWNLKLPRETMHYVPRILAAMIIGHNPSLYGFHVEDPEPLPDFDTVTVKECVPLQSIAEASGTSLTVIKDLNPELNRWCTPPNSKGYVLRIPEGTLDQFTEAYEKMDKSKFAKWYQHKVRSGENLGKIARAFGFNITSLKQVNGLKNNHLRVGQVILIPMPQGAAPPNAENNTEASDAPAKPKVGQYTVHKGDKLATIARRFGVSPADVKAWNNLSNDKLPVGKTIQISAPRKSPEPVAATTASASAKAGTATYTVKAGDNYYSISQAFGVSMDDLMELNKAKAEAKLTLGQVLKLPANAHLSNEIQVASASKTTKNKASEVPEWYVVKDGDNLAVLSRKYQVAVSDLMRWNKLDSKAVVKVGQKVRVHAPETVSTGTYHTVRKGDTLWDISRRYGVTVQQILDWNSIPDGKVKTGTRLKVGA